MPIKWTLSKHDSIPILPVPQNGSKSICPGFNLHRLTRARDNFGCMANGRKNGRARGRRLIQRGSLEIK